MPTYEYQCEKCETRFEFMKGITDETIPDCPSCGSGQVRRAVSWSSFKLNGSGWYVTDYGKSGSTHTPPQGEGKDEKGTGDSAPSEGGGGSDKTPSSDAGASSDKKNSSDKKPEKTDKTSKASAANGN